MNPTPDEDYYELLQISAAAEPETIHRVYRLLAARFHPDNSETGDAGRFRAITEAYQTLSDPEQRRQQRWRLVSHSARPDNDFEAEQIIRQTVLEVLYSRRRSEPYAPSLSQFEVEEMTGTPREHLEFTIWYLLQKKLVTRADSMDLAITADGVEYVEQSYRASQTRRLQPAPH
jgi:curved DNA-binding protein CbpA